MSSAAMNKTLGRSAADTDEPPQSKKKPATKGSDEILCDIAAVVFRIRLKKAEPHVLD